MRSCAKQDQNKVLSVFWFDFWRSSVFSSYAFWILWLNYLMQFGDVFSDLKHRKLKSHKTVISDAYFCSYVLLSELFRLHFVAFIVVRITFISWFSSIKCSSLTRVRLKELNLIVSFTLTRHLGYMISLVLKNSCVSGWRSFTTDSYCNTGQRVNTNWNKIYMIVNYVELISELLKL